MTAKAITTTLAVTLATLVAIAIAGFAFFATSEGEESGSDRKINGAATLSVTTGGAA